MARPKKQQPLRDETSVIDVVRKAMGRPTKTRPVQSNPVQPAPVQPGSVAAQSPPAGSTVARLSGVSRGVGLALGVVICLLAVAAVIWSVSTATDAIPDDPPAFPVSRADYIEALNPAFSSNGEPALVTVGLLLAEVSGTDAVTSVDIRAFATSAEDVYTVLQPLDPELSRLTAAEEQDLILSLSIYGSGGAELLETEWFTLVRPPEAVGGSFSPVTILPPGSAVATDSSG